MHHPIDRQILNRDQIKLVDDATAVLMREVASSPGETLVYPGHDLAPLGTFWRALLGLGQPALCFYQRPLLQTEDVWVLNGIALSQRGKSLQATINTDFQTGGWQSCSLGALTGEGDVSLAGTAPANRGRLGRAFTWAMQEHLDPSDVGDAHACLPFRASSRQALGGT
jgi:hypothetical protein